MNQFIETLISGLSLGFVYALVALGFVMIFKATRVVNFAHGSFVLLGAYVIARTHGSLGFVGAVAVGIAVSALVAALVHMIILRRIRGSITDTVTIATIGIDILLATDLTRRIGARTFVIGDPWHDHVVHLAGFTVPSARLAAAVVALIVLGAFVAVFKYSGAGVAMRAAAEDSEAAALMGVRLSRVSAAAWALAGGLAALGGVFLTTFPTPGVDGHVGTAALAAFPAAILGGLDSVAGAVVGGLIIGVVVAMTGSYQEDLSFLGRGLSDVMPYAVMVLVLLVRPAGLFGTKEITRV